MNKLVALWNKIRSNPLFVAAWTAFAGALGKELLAALQTGSFDWSLKAWQGMAEAAVSTAVIALIHLYLPQPNPTVPATFPPSRTPVDVPARLEPIDPKAQPVTPAPDAATK